MISSPLNVGFNRVLNTARSPTTVSADRATATTSYRPIRPAPNRRAAKSPTKIPDPRPMRILVEELISGLLQRPRTRYFIGRKL